ncbi:MAG: plastocyanin/azurin family copper-binding protein [Candidatus Nitrosopolaris sp.]
MEKRSVLENHTAGISIVAFVIAVGISLGYYQFLYVPQSNEKPVLPPEVLNPPQTTHVIMVPGSSSPSQTINFVPKQAQGTLGVSNRVVWTNTDSVPHSVTSDDGYNDIISGPFNSIQHIGLIPPQQKFTFVFTVAGVYSYHCEPHPWMQGKVTIAKEQKQKF